VQNSRHASRLSEAMLGTTLLMLMSFPLTRTSSSAGGWGQYRSHPQLVPMWLVRGPGDRELRAPPGRTLPPKRRSHVRRVTVIHEEAGPPTGGSSVDCCGRYTA
jgi:hypothetical protein